MYWWLWLIPITGTLVFLWFLRKAPTKVGGVLPCVVF
jgi:hypothetical protein